MASCITLSCISEKGPPCPAKPIRFAGTWHKYSRKAIDQLNTITPINGKDANQLNYCFNFKCPYQAKVMNILDITNKPTVYNAFIPSPFLNGCKDIPFAIIFKYKNTTVP